MSIVQAELAIKGYLDAVRREVTSIESPAARFELCTVAASLLTDLSRQLGPEGERGWAAVQAIDTYGTDAGAECDTSQATVHAIAERWKAANGQ